MVPFNRVLPNLSNSQPVHIISSFGKTLTLISLSGSSDRTLWQAKPVRICFQIAVISAYVMETPVEAPAKKPKRLTSVVWNHFERVRKGDICYAVCKHCQKKLSGSSNSGTTHLRNHLVRCLKRSNYDVSQILASKRKRKDNPVNVAIANYDEVQRKDDSVVPMAYKFEHEPKKEEIINLGSVKFEQERSRHDLARMIMLHDYPLSMVDHVGFKIFVKNLQPLFDVMSNSEIEVDCMTIYSKEKQKVYDMLHNLHGRISLALGTWTSPENVGYLGLTANYIDDDWKLQKKLLNFLTLDPSQTDDLLSELVIKSLMDWDVDRQLFSMTLDDCFSYDDIAFRTKDWLSQNKPLLKNGELFDLRCAAHLVKSIAQDAIEALDEVTQKVRESVRHVKSSQATQVKFNEISQQVGINTEKNLFLDYPMRWNSTYFMLERALEYRSAFFLLQEQDSAFTVSLSDTEWELASSVTSHIRLFVEVTNIFSGTKHPTANIFFPEICDVHIQLIDWCRIPDDFVSSIAVKMKNKFDKYWSKCSLSLAIAAILDPRFKMKLVEYYYPQIYGSDAPNQVKEVSEGIRQLFIEYSVGSALDQNSAQLGSSGASTSNGTRDRLRGFDRFLHETSQSQSGASDLDKYLEEPIFPRNYDFNILNWWKVHTPRYPTLSMMARDILAMPLSTLTPDLAFSTGSRVLNDHLRSLTHDTRQALICGRDWLRVESEETMSSASHSIPALPYETE